MEGPPPYEPMEEEDFDFVSGQDLAMYALEVLGAYMAHLEELEAEEADGAGAPQAPQASVSGSLGGPPRDQSSDDDDLNEVY